MNFGEEKVPFRIDQKFLDAHDQIESNSFKEDPKVNKRKSFFGFFKSKDKKKQSDEQDTLSLQDSIAHGSISKKQMPSIGDVSAISGIQRQVTQTKSKSSSDIALAEFLGNEDYSEVDMGQIDEEELPFMIIDKDSGKVYDTRNDKHVERLSNVTASFR